MYHSRISIRELAKDTGIPKSSLARRLHAKQPFNIAQLVAIADRLSVPLVDLLPSDTERAA